MIVERVQTQLQQIYGIDLPHQAADYLIDKKEALNLLNSPPELKIPEELFLVRKSEEDTVEVALFLDQRLINNLKKNNPFISINDRNLSDFCVLIEGVSHFVYFLFKADRNHPVSQLEMELQAEIDKFLMLFFYLRSDFDPAHCQELFNALFENFRLIDELTNEAKDRYLTASTLAARYCYYLQQTFRSPDQTAQLIEEIRRFYQFSQEQKIQHITH